MPHIFIWSTLPNGVSEGVLRASIVLSPRLTPSGVLSDFGIGNWPSRVKGLQLSVETDGGVVLPADVSTAALREDVWEALFPGTVPVNAYDQPNHAGRRIRSFPVRPLLDKIHGLYAAVAADEASMDNHASYGDGSVVGGFIGTIGQIPDVIRRNKQNEDAILKALGTPEEKAYALSQLFFDRGNQQPVAWHGQPRPPIPALLEPPKFDFHQAVSALSDHPSVLRMLGLIIDITVKLPSTRGAPIAASGKIRVHRPSIVWKDPPTGQTDEAPWTAYEHGTDKFVARPRLGSDLDSGFLRLGETSAFDVFQVDVNGAALKTYDLAANQVRYRREAIKVAPSAPAQNNLSNAVGALPAVQRRFDSPARAPERGALPSLRSNGFTIGRTDRASQVKNRLIHQAAHNALMSDTVLYLDDVLVGYRVDVLDGAVGTWRSLCRRLARYKLGALSSIEVHDEGYVTGSAATRNPGSAPMADLYLHEGMFGWDGWSLVATRPGRTISFDKDPMTKRVTHAVKDWKNEPLGDFKIEPEEHAEPGSLPKLRYGHKYQFRARATDLAGNSLPYDTTANGAIHTTKPQPFLRYEPVQSPQLVQRAEITLGEQLETMVIRTKLNAMASEAELPAALFNAQNERHVVPPKTTQWTAETHGMLDGIADRVQSYRVSAKEKGTLQDQQILDASTGAMVPVANIELKHLPETPADKVGVWPMPGEELARGQYVIHTGDKIKIPYLPDPIGRGVTIDGGMIVPCVKNAFGGAWPEYEPFRLVLTTGGGPPSVGPDGSGNLVAKLLPGDMVKVQYSSYMDGADLDLMALWNLLPAAAKSAMGARAKDGRHWMLTPWRELQLIHAVERPTGAPDVTPMAHQTSPAEKTIGQTFTLLDFVIKSPSHSTGEVSIDAQWEEIEDRMTQPGPPVSEPRTGHVLIRQIGYDEGVAHEPKLTEKGAPLPRHEFGDTKHRWVKYSATGTTRYREYFPHDVTDNKKLITLTGPPSAAVNILSSARPEALQVLYVLPTFKWEESADGKTRRRIGRGLRVYMERPWYTTGVDELLGVVVVPNGTKTAAEDVAKYVSEWGGDPVLDNTGPTVELQPTHLLNKVETLDGLTLAERGGLTVTACGFNVEFNAERQLWYADIELNPGRAYWPYVRLSLARFQPHSIPDAHLSRTTKVEFMQLVSDRVANIVITADGYLDVTVVGFSASTEIGRRLPLPPSVQPFQVANPNLPLANPQIAPPSTQLAADSTDVNVVTRAPGNLPTTVQGNAVLDCDPDTLPPPWFPGFMKNLPAGAGHVLRMHLERRDGGNPSDLGWRRASDDVILDPYTWYLSWEVFWKNKIKGPDASSPAGEYRLVIEEYEIFETDRDVRDLDVPVYGARSFFLRERLVYVDTFALGTI